jgi:hypothetical protein
MKESDELKRMRAVDSACACVFGVIRGTEGGWMLDVGCCVLCVLCCVF